MTSLASALSVAVVGSINVDLIAATERLPGPGETVGGGALRRDAGGKGANQAVAAARLGARVRMIGAVGQDGDGEWMRESLAAAGVGVADVADAGAATGTALIVVDGRGENQIAVCEGANAELTIEGTRFGDEEIVLTQLETAIEVTVQLCRRVPGFLVVNAAPARPLPALVVERADLIIVNETEYSLMPELKGARLVAVTYGAKGASLLERGVEVASAPAAPAEPVNTVGAGDAFCAALALALRSGLDAGAALRTACAVGAAAVGDPSSQPALDALEAYVPRD